MQKETIEILTSFKSPKKVCVMGNVAVARGAIEAGVNGVFSYPGTPSTEISEVFNFVNEFQNRKENEVKYPELTSSKIYFEYSINEKIALEKAIAYTIGHKSAMCVMKNVGLNVASDALMTIAYQTICAPLVLVVCDDPGCFSSSNEQDTRHWAKMASIPMFNPATPEEAYEMTKDAFQLSEKLMLPVIVRMTTRVDHSRNVVSYNEINKNKSNGYFERSPLHINIPARNAVAHKNLLAKLTSDSFSGFYAKNNFTVKNNSKPETAIIASGVAYVYAKEILERSGLINKFSLLKLGLIFPFPEKEVINFLKNNYPKILILEELDSIIEDEIRVIAQKQKSKSEIFGKNFSGLTNTGEYTLDIIENAIATFSETEIKKSQPIKISENISQPLPPRPPLLCAGCPHRSTFYALKLAIPRDDASVVMCGDIGCLGLGALAPMQMIDTIHHMGMSISMAQGLSEALRNTKNNKTVALLGDGTFFHSGVQSLLNAVYTKANFTLIIFDNRTVGMTGHQDNPGAVRHDKYHQINIHQLVRGMGIEHVNTIDPFDLKSTFSKIKSSLEHVGISVLIAHSPCVFLPEFKDGHLVKRTFKVDATKCNSCANHCDGSEWCSKESTQKNSLVRAKAMITGNVHIPGIKQLCPANICNHGFFNSVLAGNHKEALEIVRDKMLFAKVCGDICHKPCEASLPVLSKGESTSEELTLSPSGRVGVGRIPIRNLKHFVTNIENNFNDFSKQISRATNAETKNKTVAVIGAGPAGLSAAYDLIQSGYEVTVYEREEKAGGMIRFIIPNFRVDKNGMEREISVLEKMGVKFKFNQSLGKEISIDNLSKDFDAVVLAVGMWNSQSLEIIEKNISKEKWFDAISFLKMFNQKILPFGEDRGGVTILIIGGGNSAMDAARSAKKLNPKNNVIVSCIEKLENMPAFVEEIVDALKENIRIIDNSLITSVKEENGKISINLNSFNEKTFIENIHPDFIITAIGQKGESNYLNTNITSDENYRIERTEYKNVFAAGDILKGNHNSLIGAIGSGKRAAVQVRSLLENYEFEYEGEIALNKLIAVSTDRRYEQKNIEITIDNISEVISEFDLFQTCAKCNHCIDNFGCPAMLKVDGKVVIDEKRCTSCGLCLDVCPNRAIYVETETVAFQ